MAMTPLELVKAARKAVGDDMPDDICPDDLWGPVKGSSSRDKSSASATVSSSSSSTSLAGDVATTGATSATTTTTSSSSSSSGKSVSSLVELIMIVTCHRPCSYLRTSLYGCEQSPI